MIPSSIDTVPYCDFRYYPNVQKIDCPICNKTVDQYLMRMKTYLIPRIPIFTTGNVYYTVCSSCYDYKEVTDELLLMRLLDRSRNMKPHKYNKYSILDLATQGESNVMTYAEQFEYALVHHVKDIKKRLEGTD